MCKNFLKRLMFLISTNKIIILSLCCFSEILFLGGKLHADSFDKRLQYYVKDAKDLADIFYKHGFNEVEAKAGMHAGTF